MAGGGAGGGADADAECGDAETGDNGDTVAKTKVTSLIVPKLDISLIIFLLYSLHHAIPISAMALHTFVLSFVGSFGKLFTFDAIVKYGTMKEVTSHLRTV